MKTTVRRGVFKRSAELPPEAKGIQGKVSKSDLMEIAWDLASICNDGEGADDGPATRSKLVEFLNVRREARGQKTLKL